MFGSNISLLLNLVQSVSSSLDYDGWVAACFVTEMKNERSDTKCREFPLS